MAEMLLYHILIEKQKRLGEKMQIHRRNNNESIKEIAENYGICEENLRVINNLSEGEAAKGEELLILTPTRSYTTCYGDTPERIAIRFGIRSGDIYSCNPWLTEDRLNVGEKIALKYDERRYGMAVANGYCYKGCTKEMLRRAMPYLTYVTFAGGVADESGVHRSADFKAGVEATLDARKIPLIRIYDRYIDRYKKGCDLTQYAEQMISLALNDSYKGIVLDSCPFNNSADEFVAFLMILRKLLIGCDLILITEINENSPIEFSEFADGSVMYFPKYSMDSPLGFEEGERGIFSDFACRGESAKTFIDLPSLARRGREFTTIESALRLARREGAQIEHNESTLLSHFRDRKQGEYVFSSLKNIKSLLDLVNEFDYMGICFDIMRTPLSHIMMYNSMFKTSYLTPDIYRVKTPGGCSRADEE